VCHSKRCAALIASAITRSEFMKHETHTDSGVQRLIGLVQKNGTDVSLLRAPFGFSQKSVLHLHRPGIPCSGFFWEREAVLA
jgi:hypothetical protein